MSEVTGRLIDHRPFMTRNPRPFEIIAHPHPIWARRNWWTFRRRIDAIAFAARKGIRLETK